ncbi:unnamed protein product, partial [Didymodactylos carnosus]
TTTTTTLAPLTQPVPTVCSSYMWNATAQVINIDSSGSTQVSAPYDVAIDSNQNIYVADYNNQRVQQWQSGQKNGSTIAGVTGQGGNGFNQFNRPTSVFVDTNGNLYVADRDNYRIQRWAPNSVIGVTVAGGNGLGNSLTQFGPSYSIYVDANMSIYISDYQYHRVVKWVSGAPNCTVVAGGNGAGSSLTQLHNPIGITVDTTTGNLYAADSANHRVQRWSPGAWQGMTVAGQSGVPGTGSNQFNTPRAVQLDRQGYLYISDYANTRIQRWVPNAVYGVTILATTSGKGTNQWTYPYSMKTDQLGNLYVVDAYTNRVQKYTLSCGPTTTTTTLAPLTPITALPPRTTGNIQPAVTSNAMTSAPKHPAKTSVHQQQVHTTTTKTQKPPAWMLPAKHHTSSPTIEQKPTVNKGKKTRFQNGTTSNFNSYTNIGSYVPPPPPSVPLRRPKVRSLMSPIVKMPLMDLVLGWKRPNQQIREKQ